MESIQLKEVALAGLFHDIGLLEQYALAGAGALERSALAERFINQHVPPAYQRAALAGCHYQDPQQAPPEAQPLSRLVALADRLSHGIRGPQGQASQVEARQMVSIFDRTTLSEPRALDTPRQPDGWHYVPLAPLALSESALFPTERWPAERVGVAYRQARDAVAGVCAQPSAAIDSYLENLLGGLQRAAWCIPADPGEAIPDVSFYDHSRMTSALAACLAQSDLPIDALWQSLQAGSAPAGWPDQPLVQLIGGDISGIQDFIYTISSKGAAKSLRGRSFYLQLLTEAVLRFVLAKLELPYTNVIYAGGGHFFLLAPAGAGPAVGAIQREITQKLLRHHQTSLYLTVGCTPVPLAGFRQGAFTQYWNAMHRALEMAKKQRYTELGDQFYQAVFEPAPFGGDVAHTCSVCGEDYRAVRDFDEARDEQARICSLCDSFISELGSQITGAAFIALGLSAASDTRPGKASDTLRSFGLSVQCLKNAGQRVSLPGAERVVIWALDDPAQGWPAVDGLPVAHLLRYSVNHVPEMTFDQLQEQVAGGFKRLGVLRMDVDNLSDIFKEGFGKAPMPGLSTGVAGGSSTNLASLARLAGLSFRMSLFFEGWVKRLCEDPAYQGLIYSVYAGGDDVFLIGPWDKMPGLAEQIASDFKRYTGGHPDYHLSAGLAFIDGKYPVYQAAEDAADELGKAKARSGKNAFAFLGSAESWDEFAQLNASRQSLAQIAGDGANGQRSLLQVLQQLAQDRADHAKKKKIKGKEVFGPWIWQGQYLLTRMAERAPADEQERAQAILKIRKELHDSNYQAVEKWGKAALWVELFSRKAQAGKDQDR